MLIGGKKKFAESLSLWRLRITKSGFERVIITHNYTADIFGRKSLTIHNYTLGNNYTLPDYNFWFFLKDLYTSQKLHDKKLHKDAPLVHHYRYRAVTLKGNSEVKSAKMPQGAQPH